jgi:hypothetical protein
MNNVGGCRPTVVSSVLPIVAERAMYWPNINDGWREAHNSFGVTEAALPITINGSGTLVINSGFQIFAEGFQGFFDTYLLIANANAVPTNVTLTFLQENGTPVVKTVEVAAFQRKTIYAGDFDELKGRAFGIVVEATEPVIAERAMYFSTQPNRTWAGGHVNTGIVAPRKRGSTRKAPPGRSSARSSC